MKSRDSSPFSAPAAGIPADPGPSPGGDPRPAESPTQHLLTLRPGTDLADALAGIHWFNTLTRSERLEWLERAGSSVPADAWEAFKCAQTGASEVS
jgi:hypothetical protein